MQDPKPLSNDEDSLPPNRYLRKLDIKLIDGKYENPVQGQVRDPEQVCDIFRSLKDEAHETLLGVFLTRELEVRAYNILSTGDQDSTAYKPKQVFKQCILLEATDFILIHNHPKGGSRPSFEDKQVMASLMEKSQIMEIKFLDFIILGSNNYWSMFETLDGGEYGLGVVSDPADILDGSKI